MNSLSWLIYLVYTLDATKNFFLFLTVFGTIGMLFVVFFHCVHFFASQTDYGKKEAANTKTIRNNIAKYIIPMFVVGWIGFIFVPTKETMVLIASSEFGEMMLKKSRC